MYLGDGYREVKQYLGEGPEWLFSRSKIISDLNRSARGLCSASQALRDTYAFTTRERADGTFYQEYAMPQGCESITSAKAQIGTLWPLDLSHTQQELQQGGFVAGAPVMGYIRRSTNYTQQIPGSSETVFPIPGATGRYAPWILGLYPVPASEYQVFVDYVAYHPEMTDPLDAVLLPDIPGIFDAWTAYAKARGAEAQADPGECARQMDIYNNGLRGCADYLFAQQCQVTPPQWGGGMGVTNSGLSIVVMAPTAANISIE